MNQITGTNLASDSSPSTSAEICYVVDDDPSMRKAISRLLELEGFKVCAFGDPEDFLNEMATNPVRLVVLDIWMERMTGMELLAHLCARSPETRVIFMTGHEDRAAEATVMRAGASAFFIKPLETTKNSSQPFATRLSNPRDQGGTECALPAKTCKTKV